MPSIRSKILAAFLGLGGALIAMSWFSWADLRFLEQQVRVVRMIDGLRERAQEMRRHEKNALLYRQADEGASALALADALRAGLRAIDPADPTWRPALGPYAEAAALDALRQDVESYRGRIGALQLALPGAGSAAGGRSGDDALRTVGHRISGSMDALANAASTQLASALASSQRALLLFAATVLAIALVVAAVLARAVVRPLRELERNLKPLAEGRFDTLPVVSDDREMVSLIGALSRLFEELEQRRRRALQAEKLAALGVLAAGVAHELNNPLGNVSAAAQILREEAGALSIDQTQWFAQIDAEILRAQGIVQRLLDYAQRQPGPLGRVPLAEVVRQALALLRARFPAAATVRVDISDEVAVTADRQRLQQAFINLIGNALASPREGLAPRVSVSATAAGAVWPPSPTAFVVGALEAPGPGVTVCVCDEGPGIPRHLWSRVFDPFFTTREPGKGVGLGLFVVAEIVQESGGAVAVDASPGGGARFCLAFP